jgi:integrase
MPRLTAKAVENFKPRAVRVELPDAGCKNLYLVVQPLPSGAKSFAARYRIGSPSKARKLTLKHPDGRLITGLADARVACTAAMKLVADGVDPAAARQKEEEQRILADGEAFMTIAESYMKREGSRLRSAHVRSQTLHRLIYPRIGSRPIGQISRREIVTLLDHVEDHNGPVAANAVLAFVRKIMNWHATRDDLFRSPIVPGMARIRPSERERSRILSDDEIAKLWHATEASTVVVNAQLRFLLLTAARRAEVTKMKWDELEGDVWILPASRDKSKRGVTRPLSKAAMAILDALPRIDDCPYVFSNDGRRPAIHLHRPKASLAKNIGSVDWTIHDLRRTARSLLSRAGISSDIAEMCLGHTKQAIRRTYDRFEYIEAKRHAFEALAALIARIVRPLGDNVIELRA